MSLSSKAKEAIVNRIMQGDANYAELGRKHGVSREYIRQIAYQAGVTGREQRAERRDAALADEALILVDDREMYVPPRWGERTYTRPQFEAFLAETDKALLRRWREAQSLPISRSGHAHPNGQRCTDCEQWKTWDEFYLDSSRVYGRSSRCQECGKIQSRATYQLGRES